VCALACTASSAWAAETHIFDAALSLTGDCSTSPTDPVADPGCPGGMHPVGGPFIAPTDSATDEYGDLYVAGFDPNTGLIGEQGLQGRIDIFDSTGHYITEIASPQAREVAVDGDGNLYVYKQAITGETEVLRYAPSSYDPALGDIAYGNPPTTVLTKAADGVIIQNGIAINPANDHLFVNLRNRINEYGSAAEGNPLLPTPIGTGTLDSSNWVSIDAANNRIYASTNNGATGRSEVNIYNLQAPHELLLTVNGSTTPAGRFFAVGTLSIAPEEATGHFFVDDLEKKARVYEFTASGEYVSTVQHNFNYVFTSEIAMDNGALSPNAGTLFVPSGEPAQECCHVYAFPPKFETAPVVEAVSASNVTENDAEVRATIVPNAPEAEYRIEYTTLSDFEEEGFVGATTISTGKLVPSKVPTGVSASGEGLQPGTSYRVRVTAENSVGASERQAGFTTFSTPVSAGPCENEGVRTGPSAVLPDCRAYELVTPPDTGGHPPLTIGNQGAGPLVGTLSASAAGDSLAFLIRGGPIPGTEGAGSFNPDSYVATRGTKGWQTILTGPTGSQSSAPQPGGMSPDHSFGFSTAGPPGSLATEEKEVTYVRYPDGTLQLLGRGSLENEPFANPSAISAGGAHIIFITKNFNGHLAAQIEPQAPPAGTTAIYDRTVSDEASHVISLLPGGVTPNSGEAAIFLGASQDGSLVAFKIGASPDLYVRVDNTETLIVAESAGSVFEGASADGRYVFYLAGGDLFRFDTENEETLALSSSGDVTVVNVAAGGTTAAFVSPTDLTPGEPNPLGAEAQQGENNFYVWRGGALHFIGTVTDLDVEGEQPDPSNPPSRGLGLWAEAQLQGRTAIDPSRFTPDGTALVFESRVHLTDYDAGGQSEIYRYDAGGGDALDCLSCSPTKEAAVSGADLQNVQSGFSVPVSSWAQIPNMSADGRRVVFETADPLVLSDTDGIEDVYEWEADGVGSCVIPEGCVFLISSGHSARPNYLFGVSASGGDIFISTSDRLLRADIDETPSVYDARVGGGSPEPEAGACEGEACRGQLGPVPVLPPPASGAVGASGNFQTRKCPKGKHRVKKQGKEKCVKNHSKHKKKSTKTSQRGARR
jgi:hypothetical protein